jgi:hypothetical protein
MSKRDAAIYREAARRVIAMESHGCCHAIAMACISRYMGWSVVQERFGDVFSPLRKRAFWWGDPYTKYDTPHGMNASRKARVIALCLAAAMAESGDL